MLLTVEGEAGGVWCSPGSVLMSACAPVCCACQPDRWGAKGECCEGGQCLSVTPPCRCLRLLHGLRQVEPSRAEGAFSSGCEGGLEQQSQGLGLAWLHLSAPPALAPCAPCGLGGQKRITTLALACCLLLHTAARALKGGVGGLITCTARTQGKEAWLPTCPFVVLKACPSQQSCAFNCPRAHPSGQLPVLLPAAASRSPRTA